MKIEQRRTTEIRPYEHNPRINDQAVDAVAASIREFGFRQPIVIDKHDVIICGHTRYRAALKLGLDKVPVHVATGLTDAQVKAYRIADNRTNELAEWNMDVLPVELAALGEMDFDLDLLGFSGAELSELLAPAVTDGLTDPDAVPAPPDEAVTKRGEVCVLGAHRLMCGDSSNPEDVDVLLDGATIALVNTDPPYNVRVEPRSRNAIAAGLSSFEAGGPGTDKKLRAKDRPLENDFVSDEEFERLLLAWFGNLARVLEPGRAFYIWGGYANVANYPKPLAECGLYFSQAIIWDKQHPVLTRKDYMGAHEWCFYGWREGAAHKYFGPANATDLWHLKKVNPQSMVHLTEKPVELAQRAIEYSTKPGENVLDLFGGSGSTLIACQQTGRRGYLMEIDRLYCDVIVQRWEQFTGQKAARLSAETSSASGSRKGRGRRGSASRGSSRKRPADDRPQRRARSRKGHGK